MLFNLKTANSKKDAILIQTYLSLLYNPLPQVFIKIINLINTSNTVPVFVDEDSLIKKHNIIIKRLLVPKPLRLANRLLSSFITYYFIIIMTISHHTESMLFYVTKLLPFILVILRMPWLKKHNPKLNFSALGLKFNFNYCAYNCFL